MKNLRNYIKEAYKVDESLLHTTDVIYRLFNCSIKDVFRDLKYNDEEVIDKVTKLVEKINKDRNIKYYEVECEWFGSFDDYDGETLYGDLQNWVDGDINKKSYLAKLQSDDDENKYYFLVVSNGNKSSIKLVEDLIMLLQKAFDWEFETLYINELPFWNRKYNR